MARYGPTRNTNADETMSETPSYFSKDYTEARNKFLRAATALDLDVASHLNPNGKTPDGTGLYTDIVRVGDKAAPAKLLIMSATHGVEGFCGSGVQVGFLKTMSVRQIPANVEVILVHAINPYGFAWLRRVNEDNVDLNRNFVDHALKYPQNAAYEELKELIAPIDISRDAMKAANAKLRDYAEAQGAIALQGAVSCGQYAHTDGLYYGGSFATWSNKTFRKIVADVRDGATALALVDFHTGLGPYGYGEPIIEFATDDPAYGRAKAWYGDSVKSTVGGESVSAHLSGTIDGAMPDMAPRADVTAMALEFGTVPSNEVFRALRKDNWLHLHGELDSELGRSIKAELRAAFYPDADDWKEMIWARGLEVINQAIAGLAASTEA